MKVVFFEEITQAMFCEYCEIFKSTYFEERLQRAGSEGSICKSI